jgi:hypothetical protein
MAILPLVVIGLAAAAAGGIGTAINTRKRDKALNEEKKGIDADMAENASWYNSNALSDYTQRADSQRLLKNLRDNLKRNRTDTTATAAVTGATPAAIAEAKRSDANAVSDTYSNLAAMGQQYKDDVTRQYFNRKGLLRNRMSGVTNAKMGIYNDNAGAWTDFSKSGLNLAAGAFGS